jgi:hypothetical protein
MKPNLAVNRTVLGAASPASAAGYLECWASTKCRVMRAVPVA